MGTYFTNYSVTISSNIVEDRRRPFEDRRRPSKTVRRPSKTVEDRWNIVEDRRRRLIRPIRPIRPIRLIRLIRLIHLIPDTFDQNTWWETQIHGGEPMHGGEPTYMVAWPLWWGARLGGQGGARGRPRGRAPLAPIQPGPPPKLACWLARPPCMWAPHHVFGFPTMYFDQRFQVTKLG